MSGWVVIVAGSNVEPAVNLPAALAKLGERAEVVDVSSIYETAPVGAPGTPNFWNAAIRLRWDREAELLKGELLRPIEAELGRVRGDDPNAPREIDLDLVLWSGGELEDPAAGLRLPDPELPRLAHMAVPASEVAPDWIDPGTGLSLQQLAAGFRDRVRAVAAPGWRR